MAYCEAISLGSKSKDLAYRVPKKYMGITEPKLLEFTYRRQFVESILSSPILMKKGVQAAIEDLSSTIPKLKKSSQILSMLRR